MPHYEKMLADNAELLSLYAAAFERTGDAAFSSAGHGILRFLFAKLYDPATGAFFASQDADEEYYPLPAEERSLRVPPSVDRTVFSEYNAKTVSALVAAHTAFEGRREAPPPEAGAILERAERLGAFLHAEMCENWKYEKIAHHVRKESIDEMKHAEAVIERILFLDGTPIMTAPLAINVDRKSTRLNSSHRT